jgi:purine nucleosidase
MSESEPIRAIIDTDPGIDDAVAILFALKSGFFDIRGITTVAGNLGIETTTRNAGRILALGGRPDIPVIAAAKSAISGNRFDSKDVHGDDGLGGVPFPEPLARPLPGDAVDWLAKVLAVEPAGTLDILALGPLTNIARLVVQAPEIARRMRRLIAMGGAVDEPGNVGPRAEFNLAADPEAAEIVFSARLPLTLIPLDVTRKVRADLAWCDELDATAMPCAAAAAGLVRAYFRSTQGRESRPLHDPCVMLFATRPDLFECQGMALTVDTGQGPDAGSLMREPAGPEISVAMRVQAQEALAILADGLRKG